MMMHEAEMEVEAVHRGRRTRNRQRRAPGRALTVALFTGAGRLHHRDR